MEHSWNEPAHRRAQWRAVVLAIVAFSFCSAAAAIRSQGFLESDGGTHYLFARHAIGQPIYFVDVWGRPLCTALFALPAQLGGLVAVRLTSLGVALGCALVAFRLAILQQYRWPALAAIFTLGQPLLFLHSFSELTELPFALVIGLAFWAYSRRRWGTMAILAAIGPCGRPEGFFFLALAAVALAAHRQWKWLLALPLGLLAWSIAGHQLVGPADAPWWRWLIDHWPYEAGTEYPRGSLFYFLAILPMLVGPFALPAIWIGMGQNLSLTVRPARLTRDHQARVQWLTAALPLAILIGHSLLHWLGKLSSSGAPRYLLIVAPFWGLLAARGWEWTFQRLHWRRPLPWAALAVVTPGLVNFCYRVLPLEQPGDWLAARRVVAWYRSSEIRQKYPRVMSNHPGVFYFLDAGLWDRRRIEPWTGQGIDHPPPGVLLLWDPVFCPMNSDPKLVVPLDRARQAGWVDDWEAQWASTVNNPPPKTPQSWHIFLSPLDAQGKPTPSVRWSVGKTNWAQTPGDPAIIRLLRSQ